MSEITIGDIPLDQLNIGDSVISLTGKKGVIAGIYPVGTKDPHGNDWDDWDGGVLMLWLGPTWSIAGWSELKVIYDN